MGSNTIIAIVVGAILVIVGFALWPVLNGASNSLYSYFQDSCDDGNGNRFGKAYIGNSRNPSCLSGCKRRTTLAADNTAESGVNIVAAGTNCSHRLHQSLQG